MNLREQIEWPKAKVIDFN